MSRALLFPGQGSQYVGMGKALAEAFPAARETFEEADDLLGFALSRLLWEGPAEVLTETRNAQPAILVHSMAILRVLGADRGPVVAAAGHSLGEFSAWVAAGTLEFAAALHAVRLRGERMFAAGEVRPGSMAALLGMEDGAVDELCREASRGAADLVVAANYNAPGQVVISGDVTAVTRAMEAARGAGARKVVSLKVSGAFHSPLMEPAAETMAEHLAGITFETPHFPVQSNVTAAAVTDPEEARDLLVQQLTRPVRWAASVEAMVAAGVETFVEVGPGTVLTGLNRRNARGATSLSLDGPEDLDAFAGS